MNLARHLRSERDIVHQAEKVQLELEAKLWEVVRTCKRQTDLTPAEQWEFGLKYCRSDRLAGLTPLFREKVPKPVTPQDPLEIVPYHHKTAYEELFGAGQPSPLVLKRPRTSSVRGEVKPEVSFVELFKGLRLEPRTQLKMENQDNVQNAAGDQDPPQAEAGPANQNPDPPQAEAGPENQDPPQAEDGPENAQPENQPPNDGDGDQNEQPPNDQNQNQDQAAGAGGDPDPPDGGQNGDDQNGDVNVQAEEDGDDENREPVQRNALLNVLADFRRSLVAELRAQPAEDANMTAELARLRELVQQQNGRISSVETRRETDQDHLNTVASQAAVDSSRVDQNSAEMSRLSRRVSARTCDPNPTKLRPYSKDKEDFSLFENRFRTMWTIADWSSSRALQELIQNLQTPKAERVVRSKPYYKWDAMTLLEACRERLGADLNLPQIQAKLYELEPVYDETPDESMSRVEDVIARAITTDTESPDLNRLQRQAFLRLIHVHEPMYYYVSENALSLEDPYQALAVAKKYLRTRGHETDYFNKLVEQRLTKLGVKPEVTSSSDDKSSKPKSGPNSDSSGSSKKDTTVSVSAFQNLVAKVDSLATGSGSDSNVATVEARYLPTTNQADDWYKKVSTTLNEHERKSRVLQGELQKLVDGLKSAGQYKTPDASGGNSNTNVRPKPDSGYKPRTGGQTGKSSSGRNWKPNSRKSDRSRNSRVTINFVGEDFACPDDSDEVDVPETEAEPD